jgi:hypothetical protein
MSDVESSVLDGQLLIVRFVRSGRKAFLFILRATSLQRAIVHRHRPERMPTTVTVLRLQSRLVMNFTFGSPVCSG